MTEENLQKDESSQSLEELQKKSEEYLNNWKRATADLINYKKGEIERSGMLIGYAKEDVILNILPVIDSIYLLEKHAKVEGIELIKKQIEEFLKKEGIQEIKTMGDPSAGSGQVKFNPVFMEAVEQVEGEESGIVVEELQKGYKMGEKVIRPARVKINK